VRYIVPSTGIIEYHVEAEHPVTTFVLDDEGLEEFTRAVRIRSYYGGFTNRRRHDEEVHFPFRSGYWYLVIVNERHQPTAVYYQVSE
jgi:hypothetical protein